MRYRFRRLHVSAAATLLAAGQACVEYRQHPLNPVASENALRARAIPQASLDLASLIEIALRYSAEIELSRAKAASADAALVTARQRLNPSLAAEGGYNRTPDSVATYSVSPTFTIETAGKRGYRILEAEKLRQAAMIALSETEWQVRTRVRNAALAYDSVVTRLNLLRDEAALHAEVIEIYSKRVELGEAAKPELDAALSEAAAVSVSIRNAEGEVSQALAMLAAAIGVPAVALEGKQIVYPGVPGVPPLLTARKAGLLHRADIQRSLAEYEAADARLRLEVANQYPNIPLNPAYTFQEGFPAYTLGSVLESLPVFHHRQGQIAEAEAARKQAEAQFLLLQAQVISQTELAQRQYSAAFAEWTTARDSLTRIQQERERAVLSGFGAGDRDRLDVAQARLQTLAVRRTTADALARVQSALAALEAAVQSPVSSEAKP